MFEYSLNFGESFMFQSCLLVYLNVRLAFLAAENAIIESCYRF